MAVHTNLQYKIEADLLRIFAGFAVVLIHVTDLFLLQKNLVGGASWFVLDVLNILGKVAVPFFIM
ncbi:MAG: hypothetical protein KGL95_15335, partial [Patescibacteria group bacterium]|nr:hypothetical protein [Patescibacteria group bacterium]